MPDVQRKEIPRDLFGITFAQPITRTSSAIISCPYASLREQVPPLSA
jgi:hypothetical protein